MKYKGINENTLRHILQSNETALLQKAVTEMVGTITNSADSLLSSFSIEKFFSNKNFSDLSDFVKNILDNVKSITEKAYTANVNTASLEKIMVGLTKDIKINTAKTSESVNKITSTNKSANLNKDLETNNDKVSFISSFKKTITDGLKNTFPLFEKMISGIKNADTDYTAEQRADEERGRSEKQSGLLNKTTDFLLSTLAPWLKEFDENKKLESNGFLSTFFPMLANFINASPLLLKILNWGKLILGIGGSIFGIWKFVEGIGKAVYVLGHEIDFTSLHGWLEALNLGLGNIVSSITGIDLKTVYNWLHNFDRTLEGVYKRYLAPIVGGIWKSIKKLLQPFITKIQESFNSLINDFVKKYPGLVEIIQNIYGYFKETIIPFIKNNYKWIKEGLTKTLKDIGDFSRKAFNITMAPLALDENFELSFDALVNNVSDISALLQTMWSFTQKIFGSLINASFTDIVSGKVWLDLFQTAGKGILEAVDEFEKRREENRIFLKEGSKGLEKRELEKEIKEFNTKTSSLTSMSDVYGKITTKTGIFGGEYVDYDNIGNEIADSFVQTLKEAGIDSREAELKGESVRMSLSGDIERLKAQNLSDDAFLQKLNEITKATLEVYTKPLIEGNLQQIKQRKDIIQSYEKSKENIEATKEISKINTDNAMKASVQAEAEIQKEKAVQANVNAPVITDNSVHTYVEQSSNTSASNNDRDLMTSKVLTAN